MRHLFPFALSSPTNPYGSLPEDYLVLYSLVAAIKPRVILEAGTHAGVSAMAMAWAAKQFGFPLKIHTIDNGSRGDVSARAQQDVRLHGLDSFIQFHRGDSHEVLARLCSIYKSVGMAFLDADHRYAAVRRDFDAVAETAKLIVLHDSVQCSGVRRLVAELGDPFDVVTIPTKSAKKTVGITIVRRKGGD